uniref:C-type lectin domain-containing protein n=1 Tax=Mola mola TaxID=94237 RepID=A0A3Q3XP21_MOLML
LLLRLFLFLILVMTETIIPSRALGAKSPSGDHQEGLRRGGCPMSWYSLNGCSELLCVSEGANLVSIHSQGQQGFVGTLIKNWDPAEGHTCGSWMWSVGSAYDFDYRAAQEPNSVEGNKHCVDESYGPGHSFFYMPHSGCLHCWCDIIGPMHLAKASVGRGSDMLIENDWAHLVEP